MKMINRIIEPTTGRILLGGEDVTRVDPNELRRRIGYVIQQVGLFPHQTIRTNVATVPSLLGWDKRKAAARADELLAMVGLDPEQYAARYPHQLSGGEQQRVGVARALAADPPVLLMDEPFGAVDPIVRTRLQDEFLHLQRDLDKTVVMVTHDIDEAVRMGDRVAVFATGGRLAQYDVPARVLGHPADDFVAQFVGA
jgi:osmoprotectant transport system ATP-binding protein